jgi:S1-C subfamily serine protease
MISRGLDCATFADSAVSLLLTSVRITTWHGPRSLTSASGFFFRREQRLFLVTNRHVLVDAPSEHFPDRIEIVLHTDEKDLTRHAVFSVPLYRNGIGIWRQASDSSGTVDVAVVEIEVDRLPSSAAMRSFSATHLDPAGEDVAIGDGLTIIGYPLGFHDTVHHIAVARGASIASAYGVRFQQQGYFLTDARTHRGSSGSPVLRRRSHATGSYSSPLSWQLLGIHSTRMDMLTRDPDADESLGLNCAWYADVLDALTR